MTSFSSGTVLSAALQKNIFSLQQTQSQINQTQLRLSTGLKVNSATDNPQNFFQARALNARAASLSTLLDGIGQSISTIQQSSSSVTSIQDLVEQAQSIANDALSNVSTSTQEARIVGDEDLGGVNDLVAEISGIDDADQLIFSFIEPDSSVNSGNVVTISSGDSIDDLINSINAIQDADTNQVFEAQLDSSGFLDIRDLNGNPFEIEFQDGGGSANSLLASELGYDDLTINEVSDGTSVTRTSVSASASLTSIRLYEQNGGAGGTTAQASANLIDLTNSASGLQGDIFDGEAGDSLNIAVDGGTGQQVVADILTETLQDLIDGINNSTSLNTKIEASYDDDSGELNIRAIDGTVSSVQFELVEAGAAAGTAPRVNLQVLGFGFQDLTATDGGGNTSSESVEFGSAAGILATLETEFNTVLDQIDALIPDAAYSGTNLLEGDNLTTFFNEDRTSSLVTEGQDLSSSSLGISNANFGRSETIGGALDEIDSALSTVQNFGTSLSNDLSIIQTRKTFANDTINNLEEGADKLTVADQNEESAKLLALQTRQVLGIEALSLGSLSQQSTLRLF